MTPQVMPPRPPRRTATRKPSHWARNASIGVIGVFVLLAALGSAANRQSIVTGATAPPDQASSEVGASDDADASDASTPTPAGTALLSMKGIGPMTSDPFHASGDSVDVTYEYTCPTADSFTLNFYGTASSPLLPDILASEFETSGSATTTENLNGTTGPFTVEVDSPCTWTVEVVGAP